MIQNIKVSLNNATFQSAADREFPALFPELSIYHLRIFSQ